MNVAAGGVLGAALVASGVALAGSTSAPATVRVERTVYLMGTRTSLVASAADRPTALSRLERMLRVLEETEAELSTWRVESVLSALNRQPVQAPWHAPEALCRVFKHLAAWHDETDGAFDPAIGALVDAWGLGEGGRRPTLDELAAARARSGLAGVAFEPDRCLVTRLRDVGFDSGGFGKGEALDRVARDQAARSGGAWMVDLGGQIAANAAEDSDAWSVAIAHPARRTEPVLTLRLATGSLATSGGSERDGRVGNQRIGHVLDPCSRLSVSRPASVIVWRRHALAADIVSTALYVMGVEQGLRWAETRRIAAALLVPAQVSVPPSSRSGSRSAMQIHTTAAFRERFLSEE